LAGVVKLLIVDDEPDMRTFMGRTLEREGHRVIQAADARLAVDALSAQTFDLILMDIDMPGMSGLELTRLLRDNPRFLGYQHMPIVMVTGNTDAMGDAFDAGAVYFLEKPFTPRELLDTVRTVSHTESTKTQ